MYFARYSTGFQVTAVNDSLSALIGLQWGEKPINTYIKYVTYQEVINAMRNKDYGQ
jgi:hypothetical protein